MSRLIVLIAVSIKLKRNESICVWESLRVMQLCMQVQMCAEDQVLGLRALKSTLTKCFNPLFNAAGVCLGTLQALQ